MSYSELTARGPGDDCRSLAGWQAGGREWVFSNLLRNSQTYWSRPQVMKCGKDRTSWEFYRVNVVLFRLTNKKLCITKFRRDNSPASAHKRHGFWVECQSFLVLCKHTGGRSIICILVDYKRSGNLITKWWASGILPLGLGKQSFLAPFSL